jgi:hypothetical protein
MEWFYASGTDQKGPVEQVEFDRLVQAGVITPSTLVWREGMTDWKPYGEVAGVAATPSSTGSGKAEVVCSECGKLFGMDETIRLGNGFVCANCKPVAMQKLREGATNSTSEQIRQEHIKHEAAVKSVGLLYFLMAAIFILSGVSMFAISSARAPGPIIMGAVFLLCASALLIAVGVGLSRLKVWARIAAVVISGLGLLVCMPLSLFGRGSGGTIIGGLIHGYALYLLLSSKGKTVFSDGYKQIIQETPHIKYRTSIIVWILVGIVILILLLGLVGLFTVRTKVQNGL